MGQTEGTEFKYVPDRKDRRWNMGQTGKTQDQPRPGPDKRDPRKRPDRTGPRLKQGQSMQTQVITLAMTDLNI